MSDTPSTPEPAAQDAEKMKVSVRRAPKYVPFLVAGGIVGLIATIIVAFAVPNDQYDKGTIFGFFLVLIALVGVGLGGVVALIFDFLGRRRARQALVEETAETPAEEN